MSHRIITIGRQHGSGGHEIGRRLAGKLGIPFFDKERIAIYANEKGLSDKLFATIDEPVTTSFLYSLAMNTFSSSSMMSNLTDITLNDQAFQLQASVTRHLAGEGPCVIVGRCADDILSEGFRCFNVFVHADLPFRVGRVVNIYGLPPEDVESTIAKVDKKRSNYYNYCSGRRWSDATNYHLTLNSATFGIDGSVELIRQHLELAEV